MNNHSGAIWDRGNESHRAGVDLGDGVAQEEVEALRKSMVDLWGQALRLASKAAERGN